MSGTTPEDRRKEALLRARRIRWELLRGTRIGGHLGANEEMLGAGLHGLLAGITRQEVRDELRYLASIGCVKIEEHEILPWRATLTATGRDIVDYATPAPEGIERPPAYW